jgi:hypothetical protein
LNLIENFKILFYYLYFLFNDIIYFSYYFLDIILIPFLKEKLIIINYFIIDFNLFFNNLTYKTSLFFYELMKNLFDFEYFK